MLPSTDALHIEPPYRQRLRALGLGRLGDILARVDDRVVAWSRTTETTFVPGEAGSPGFYVKRYYYPSFGRRLRAALRGTLIGKHRATAEALLLRQLRAAGVLAVRPIAWGARRRGQFVTASVLVTEEVPQSQNLTRFAQQLALGKLRVTRDFREQMITNLARQVADMHANGFWHGQLFWRNILLRVGLADEPEFYFLDVRPRRGKRRLGRSVSWWVQDLAQLTVSALPFTSRAQRLRFLQQYVGQREITAGMRAQIAPIIRLAERWRTHEQKRIRMADAFDRWRERLASEQELLSAELASTSVSGEVAS